MHSLKRTFLIFIPDHAQFFQPFDHIRAVFGKGSDQVGFVVEMPAAHGIQVVAGGGVLRFDSSLHSALGHHGVGIPHTEFGGDDGFGAVLHGNDGGRTSGAAAADDQNIGFIIGIAEVKQFRFDAGVALQHLRDFCCENLTLVGADADLFAGFLLVVRMEFVEDILPFLSTMGG